MIEHQGKTYASPTYLLTSIGDFLASTNYRMLADGMLLQDHKKTKYHWVCGSYA